MLGQILQTHLETLVWVRIFQCGNLQTCSCCFECFVILALRFCKIEVTKWKFKKEMERSNISFIINKDKTFFESRIWLSNYEAEPGFCLIQVHGFDIYDVWLLCSQFLFCKRFTLLVSLLS